ncbi:MAG: sulfite exporter TauE/SafE family protein [Elusimicrobia bacterium]|nr:sulfite exporter TauE/SafE family protein [Elusimicrobiota bacterium]
MDARAGLLGALTLVTAAFAWRWYASLREDPSVRRPDGVELGIGALTDFIDTLGIGSFAPTTALLKLFKRAPDENIPGILNIGHTIPTFLEAVIFISIVEIEMKTLILMIAAAVIGAWFGAGIVAGWPRRKIQLGMAAALFAAAVFFFMKNVGLFPPGGEALGLSGAKLGIAVVGNLVLGALMTLGIGAYAPSMILVSVLGMSPITAFPIMMGSCAFLMPVASLRFIKEKRYTPGAALGLTLGGAPAVLVAAFIVKSLPMTALRWLVMLVVLYTAVMMLRSAKAERRD